MPGSGDSDGVVPVSSARQERSTSEFMVSEKHAKLTEDPDVIQETLALLRVHYLEFMKTADGLEASVGMPWSPKLSADRDYIRNP